MPRLNRAAIRDSRLVERSATASVLVVGSSDEDAPAIDDVDVCGGGC